MFRRARRRTLPLPLPLERDISLTQKQTWNIFGTSSHATVSHHVRQSHSFSAPTVDFLSLSSNSRSVFHTKQIHSTAIVRGILPSSISLTAALILNYASHGEEATSRVLFEQSLPFCGNAFLWNTLMRALSVLQFNDGHGTYNRMVRAGVRPDDHTFPFVLKACTDYQEVSKGIEIHGCVIKFGFDSDVFVGNTLLSFYGQCGSFWDAEKVFDEMPERDVVSWNTLMRVFLRNGLYVEAVCLFREMNSRADLWPNPVTIITVLPVCGRLEEDSMTRQIHCFVMKAGLDISVMIGNALVDAYGKCRNIMDSNRVFEEMAQKNEVSWNTIIGGLAYIEQSKDALDMFRLMVTKRLKPDSVTVSIILPVLIELEFLDMGRELHGFCLRTGIHSDIFISNSLIDMYAKASRVAEAQSVFDKMLNRDIVSWNAMVANLAMNGQEFAAVELVHKMQDHGEVPDSFTFTNVLPACARLGSVHPGKEIHARSIRTGCISELFVSNALMDMYTKCDCVNPARKIFDSSSKDEVSYNILIRGFAQTSESAESLALFKEMAQKGMKLDMVSFMGAISASASLSAIKQGKELHGVSLKMNLHIHTYIANSLLDLYTKCGRIELARRVFDWIQDKDSSSWNTMIFGYGMMGELDTAFELFEAMREVEHDAVSYLAVLSACSHGGLVEKGREFFKRMQDECVKPTEIHYACIVDLLGRAGYMDEAIGLVNNLPMEPSSDVLGALLGACRIHGNADAGQWAAEKLFKLKPTHFGYYVLLANLYAESGRWNEANKVREAMRFRGAKKNPGCSWV